MSTLRRHIFLHLTHFFTFPSNMSTLRRTYILTLNSLFHITILYSSFRPSSLLSLKVQLLRGYTLFSLTSLCRRLERHTFFSIDFLGRLSGALFYWFHTSHSIAYVFVIYYPKFPLLLVGRDIAVLSDVTL